MNAPDDNPEWVTTAEAARILSVAPQTLYQSETIKEAVRRRKGGERPSLLWFAADLAVIVELRRYYGLRTETAARLVKEGLKVNA